MDRPSITLTSPDSTFAIPGKDGSCGCCGMDTSAPMGMTFDTCYADWDGSDLLGEWIACYMAHATYVWAGRERVAVDGGISGCSPIQVEGKGYAYCENCGVVLLRRDGQGQSPGNGEA